MTRGYPAKREGHQSRLSNVSKDFAKEPLRLSHTTVRDGPRLSQRARAEPVGFRDQKGSAVVISVSTYDNIGTELPNTKSDGMAVALALRRAGWDVSEGDDVTSKAFLDLIDQTLLTGAKDPESFGTMFLLYFAGHGAESEGLKLAFADSSSAMSSWIGVDAIVQHLAKTYRGSSASLVLILDCCRSGPSNPLARELARPQSGWGAITVFYVCGPGGVALENEGRGYLTRSFLRHLECHPGISEACHSEIIQLLCSVVEDVHRTTRGRQTPCIVTFGRDDRGLLSWPRRTRRTILVTCMTMWATWALLLATWALLPWLLHHGFGTLAIVLWWYILVLTFGLPLWILGLAFLCLRLLCMVLNCIIRWKKSFSWRAALRALPLVLLLIGLSFVREASGALGRGAPTSN